MLLVGKGADVNAKIHQWTPALLAAKSSQFWIVYFVIETEADAHARDYDGRNLLHWAAGGDAAAMTEILLDMGVDPTARDRWGWEPLQTAANTNSRVARLLPKAMRT